MTATPEIYPLKPPGELSDQEFRATLGVAKVPVPFDGKTRLPVQFEAAIQAIVACQTIDEAKYWDNKADALAAWAKVYADDVVSREARALKLHAYRRIGQIAAEVRPQEYRGRGGVVGPNSLLAEVGFGKSKAVAIRRIAKMPEEVFHKAVNAEKPPSPSHLSSIATRPNPKWAQFSHQMHIALTAMRKDNPVDIVDCLLTKNGKSARAICDEMLDWLQGFDKALQSVQL